MMEVDIVSLVGSGMEIEILRSKNIILIFNIQYYPNILKNVLFDIDNNEAIKVALYL